MWILLFILTQTLLFPLFIILMLRSAGTKNNVQANLENPKQNDDDEGGLPIGWEDFPLDLPPFITLPTDDLPTAPQDVPQDEDLVCV
jgi:hypothetical protein